MDEGVIEFIINEAVLEFLDKVEHTVVKVLRRTGVVVERSLSGNVAVHDLLSKDVLLVKEQHNGRVGKGPVVANRPEEVQCLDHPVRTLGLGQGLVVLGECRNENDGVDMVETIDPLTPLGPLATNVVHFKVDTIDAVPLHDDLCCSDTRQQDVLCGGLEARRRNAHNVLEVLLVSINDVHGCSL